jgi:hypothetical protein
VFGANLYRSCNRREGIVGKRQNWRSANSCIFYWTNISLRADGDGLSRQHAVLDQRLRPGDRLPSSRELAREEAGAVRSRPLNTAPYVRTFTGGVSAQISPQGLALVQAAKAQLQVSPVCPPFSTSGAD